jgi:hypothetical protein
MSRAVASLLIEILASAAARQIGAATGLELDLQPTTSPTR